MPNGRRGAGGRHGAGVRALLGTCVAAITLGAIASPALANTRFVDGHSRHRVTNLVAPPQGTTSTTITMPLPAPPPPAPPDTCVKGAWAPATQGAPLAFAPGETGAYLWYDPNGAWALRVTHAGPHDQAIFSGSLTTTSGAFVDVAPMSGTGNDIVAESANKRTVYFRFVDYGLVDGLDFATQCARAFTVHIHLGTRLAPAKLVHLGNGLVSPSTNPFEVERVTGTGAGSSIHSAGVQQHARSADLLRP